MPTKITEYWINGKLDRVVERISPDGKEFICNDCGYIWETRKKSGDPAKCPKCNSQNIINKNKIKKVEKYKKAR